MGESNIVCISSNPSPRHGEGHEGDEEEGSHEGYEGDEEEGSHEGHEGDEEEGGHEGNEGDEEEGGTEGHEGHEGDEEEASRITSKVSAGIACKIRGCIASKVCARVTCKVSCSVTSKVSSSFALQTLRSAFAKSPWIQAVTKARKALKITTSKRCAFTRQDRDQLQVWGFPQLWSAASIRVWQLQ